jgi:DNA-binding MarR family transcriptional regulator
MQRDTPFARVDARHVAPFQMPTSRSAANTRGKRKPIDDQRRSDASPDQDVASALDAFRRIVRALRVAARRVEGRAHVSSAQLFVLQQLATVQHASLSQLASLTMTDRTSVAHVVERLEERGLVDRTRSAADRRRTEITITTSGRRLLARAPNAPTIELVTALGRLQPTDRRSLARLLLRLTEEMHVDRTPATMLFADAPEGGPVRKAGSRTGRRTRGARR